VRVVDDPPVVGAALLGLDAIGASQDAEVVARSALLARAKTARRRMIGLPMPNGKESHFT
jgi:hypothetical protein